MTIEKRVYSNGNGGFCYEIYCEGVCATRQEFRPDLAGFVIMTEEEANNHADAAVLLYQGG